MYRITSLIQKLASIAPQPAPLVISSVRSTHKVAYRLLPFAAALAMAGSAFAAAPCSPAELTVCKCACYASCGRPAGSPVCYNYQGGKNGTCDTRSLAVCRPPNEVRQMRPVLPGSVTDASSTLASQVASQVASQNESCTQPASLRAAQVTFNTLLN